MSMPDVESNAPRADRGCLIAVHGDLKVLQADACLVPTASDGWVRPYWSWLWNPGGPEVGTQLIEHAARLESQRAVVVPGAGPTIVLANVAITTDVDPIDWLVQGLVSALEAYAVWLSERPQPERPRRLLPLLAMPMIGTQGSGLANVRGRVIRRVLDVIDDFQADPPEGLPVFDVALVCREDSDYAAVQATRRGRVPARTDEWLAPVVDSARSGQLGVMFGAGASMPLGLPSWQGLLEALIGDLDTTELTADDLLGLDPVDAASLIVTQAEKQGEGTFLASLAKHVATSKCSLIHALIANTRPAVAVTTNYDRGYENAVAAMGMGEPAVLPWDQPEVAGQARLLKLHGDVVRGSVVLSREHFVTMQAHRRPLGGLLQERMMVGHLLVVGSTMSDPTLVLAAEEVASLLEETRRKPGKYGTVVLTRDDPARRALLSRSFDVVAAGAAGSNVLRDARWVELVLDYVAMMASRRLSFLLLPAYDDLVTSEQKPLVMKLRDLHEALHETSQDGELETAVRDALEGLG